MGKVTFLHKDVRNKNDVEGCIQTFKPDIIFHLAGQVAMTTSLSDPYLDFETNIMGGINLLEAVRKYCPNAIVLYSSTNKVYGDLESLEYEETPNRYYAKDYPHGFSETLPLNFQSPYGCSKGAVDQYMLDFNRMFGIKTVVFRHSSIYGGHQFSTSDQGWVGWFIQKALDHSNVFTISGSGKQVRDLLYVSDLVSCYFKAVEHIDKIQGQVFNLGGGMQNSLSLLELFALLEDMLKVKLNYTSLPCRASDQKVFVADIHKAQTDLNWVPKIDCRTGILETLNWIKKHV